MEGIFTDSLAAWVWTSRYYLMTGILGTFLYLVLFPSSIPEMEFRF